MEDRQSCLSALGVGSPKDRQDCLSSTYAEGVAPAGLSFQAILRRHNLVEAWAKFERQFLSDTP